MIAELRLERSDIRQSQKCTIYNFVVELKSRGEAEMLHNDKIVTHKQTESILLLYVDCRKASSRVAIRD
jgi:hypothetical protein